jgi:exosortase
LSSPTATSVKSASPALRVTRWDWLALILPALAIAPQLYTQSLFLWEKQHLQFFPLAFAAAGWFLYTEGDWNSPSQGARRNIALATSISAILLSIVSIVFVSSWLSHASLVALLWAWAAGRFSNLTWLRITGICGLLLVTVPAPGGMDGQLIQSLQSLSSIICSSLMDVSNIIHVRRGNVLEIAAKNLFVEEACSGVDSQYALMAVAGVLLLVGRASLTVSLLTIVTVPIWAILGNLLRIYTIVVGLEFFGIDLATGTVHTLLGLFVFVIAAWAHWSSVQFLNFLELKYFGGPSRNESKSELSASDQERTSSKLGSVLEKFVFAVSAITLLLTPLSFYALIKYLEKPVPRISKSAAERFPGKDDLPANIAGQQQIGFYTQERETRNILGQHSKTWVYSGKRGKQVASLDMPFRGWHPLWECYMKSGWNRIESTQIKSDLNGAALSSSFFESVLENSDGEIAILHFSLLDEDAEPFLYEGSFEDTNVQRSRWENTIFTIYSRDDGRMREKVTFQFQVLTTLEEMPSTPQLQALRDIFVEMRNRLFSKSKPVILSLRDSN